MSLLKNMLSLHHNKKRPTDGYTILKQIGFMKPIDLMRLVLVHLLLFAAMGCSGHHESKSDKDTTPEEIKTIAANADLRGQWHIESIVFSPTDYVRPDVTAPGASQYIVFEDSTYYIMTNCNSISGQYTVNGDSITLGDGAMTEMACDNMATEDALRRIITRISTIEVQNDSVVRLAGSTPSEYILLRKARPLIK